MSNPTKIVVGICFAAALITFVGGSLQSEPAVVKATEQTVATVALVTTTTTTSTTLATTTTSPSTTETAPPPAPTSTAPASTPATRATTTTPTTAVPTTSTTTAPVCDPNYSGCVPIASDVDCAGGGGNGPAYVEGPVSVVGDDVYGLDGNGDGIACSG